LLETRISEMIESGKSEIFDSLSDIPDEGRHSFMVLPLSAGGESLGAMFLERDESPFEDYDLRLMGHFAATTALALRNASLYERVNGIARELQAYNDLLAHDIANYNVPIHGYLEMLMSEPHLNEKQNEYVTKALRQSENITSMVTNVRKLAEIRLRDTMDLESMDLVRSMVKVVKRMSSSPFCHGSIIRFERHPDTAYGLASDGIEDIFVNLLTNACQYGEGGDIDIGISMHSEDGTDFWKIDFQDHGIGVPDEWKERIFSRFWENDSDRRAEAKGLGLSVVRALCIQYGGDVWVSDRVEGDPSQGSVFSVTIPAVDGP
jgi:signal transduction histidine kinase